MQVKFNGVEYVKDNRSGNGLGYLCFSIFKFYVNKNQNMNYEALKELFNQQHCTNNFTVLSEEEWSEKTEDGKSRYFPPIEHKNMKLYFTTQWGNNGTRTGDGCNSINKMIDFAKEQGYDIEVFEPHIQNYEQDVRKEQVLKIIDNDCRTKNIILYGPPGVGKTYNHKKLIALIEGQGFQEKDIFDFIAKNDDEIEEGSVEELFNKVKSENRFKFVTFHQSYSYEDFIEGFRPNEDGSIELEDGIFKQVSKVAKENIKSANSQKRFSFELFLNDFIQEVESKATYEVSDGLYIHAKKKSSGEFQSFIVSGRIQRQSLTKDIIERDFENFIDGKINHHKDVKPKYESQTTYHGNSTYYLLLYKKMHKYLQHHKDEYQLEPTTQKNFYLFIDEINRGNISKIFGELITLIEDGKRDEIEVTLPYSKELFTVPSNLYIIATMNSTDKSIALIDVALRRRFTFLKMKPDEALVDNKASDIFRKLNELIKSKLGEDYQIGHSYFMGKNLDLDFVLDYKIKPLMEEYFYSDEVSLKEALEILNTYNKDSQLGS